MLDTPQKVFFQKGIPGFTDIQDFILEPGGQAFFLLKAEHRPDVVFLLVDPFAVFPEYSFDLKDGEKEMLGLEDIHDAYVLSPVTLAKDPRLATANLLGPIIVNSKNLKGAQVVLEDSAYSTKHHIFSNRPVKGED